MQHRHASRLRSSDTILALSVLCAGVLELSFPTTIPVTSWYVPVALGCFFLVVGWSSIALAKLSFVLRGEQTAPGSRPSHLITRGIFRVSRNPIYLGIVFVIAGLGFLFNSLWGLGAALVAAIALHYMFIKPEERSLEAAFGDQYRAYKQQVRRWL